MSEVNCPRDVTLEFQYMSNASMIVIGALPASALLGVIIHGIFKLQTDPLRRGLFKRTLDSDELARLEAAKYGLDVQRPCGRALPYRAIAGYLRTALTLRR